jgi:hypothetical protein
MISQRHPWVPRLDVLDMEAAAESLTEKVDLQQVDSLHLRFDHDNYPDEPVATHSLGLSDSSTWLHRQGLQVLERGEPSSASAKL